MAARRSRWPTLQHARTLVSKIGTPDYRGSRTLSYEGEAFHAWETMASYARDIERQDYPYIPYGLPGSPTPTVNSSSAVASLIHYSGLDPVSRLPFGVHLSPGIATLLGTSGDDIMRIEHGFTTLLGGRGNDEFFGAFEPQRIEKFYGGEGDDLFHWSSGFNIIHGGQPQLDYKQDGTDAIDYSGAGKITITFNHHWVPHKVPEYVTEFEHGLDHLFSIERIQWNEATDHIVLGNGVSIVEDNALHEPVNGNHDGGEQRVPAHMRSGFLHHDGEDDDTVRSAGNYTLGPGEMHIEMLRGAVESTGNSAANRLIGNDADNVLRGLAGDDTLYGGGGDDLLLGGAGSDAYVYLHGDGNDVIADTAAPGDLDELVLAGGIDPAEVAFCRPAQAPRDLVLTLADGSIRVRDFLAGPAQGIERVVFDQAPPWTREELDGFAAAAPFCSEVTVALPPGAEAAAVGIETAAIVSGVEWNAGGADRLEFGQSADGRLRFKLRGR